MPTGRPGRPGPRAEDRPGSHKPLDLAGPGAFCYSGLMTCLVALRHSRGVVLGADSAAVDADGAVTRSMKIHRRGAVWLAASGCMARTGEMLDRVSPAANPKDLGRWLRRLRPTGSGFAWTSAGGLFEWGSGTIEVLEFSASGSGWEPAIGAIYALRALGASPVATVLGALRASAACRGDVAGPFTVVRLPIGQVRSYK